MKYKRRNNSKHSVDKKGCCSSKRGSAQSISSLPWDILNCSQRMSIRSNCTRYLMLAACLVYLMLGNGLAFSSYDLDEDMIEDNLEAFIMTKKHDLANN